jgi:hypothetical protein
MIVNDSDMKIENTVCELATSSRQCPSIYTFRRL